jgi:hypothetical protein
MANVFALVMTGDVLMELCIYITPGAALFYSRLNSAKYPALAVGYVGEPRLILKVREVVRA